MMKSRLPSFSYGNPRANTQQLLFGVLWVNSPEDFDEETEELYDTCAHTFEMFVREQLAISEYTKAVNEDDY